VAPEPLDLDSLALEDQRLAEEALKLQQRTAVAVLEATTGEGRERGVALYRLYIYTSTYLPIYLSTYLSFYLPIYLSTYPPIYLSTYLTTYLSD